MSDEATPTGQFRYRADMAPPEPKPVVAKGFRCPNCGGPVNLELPGKSQTVRCPKCSSILEPSHDVLQLREKYNEQFNYPIWIPLGKEGILEGIKFKCVGMVVRGDDDGGEWSEYLLFNPYYGYRYLVESSGHWTLVEQAPGLGFDTNGRPGWYGPTGKIKIGGKKLQSFTYYKARVKSIIGEFPWQASVGEENEVTEYINPPYQASCERVNEYYDANGSKVDAQDPQNSNRRLTARTVESNWSTGEYKYPEEIQAAFQLEKMPPRVGLGMCEPNPMRKRFHVSLAISALLFLATCGSCSIASGRAEERVVLDKPVVLNTADFELKKEGATDYLEFNFEPGSIELNRQTNVEFYFNSSLKQEWMSLNIFMINEQTGQGFIYDGELSYYYGGSGDDSWTEGSNSTDFTTEKMPAGQYYLFVAGATNIGVKEFKRNLQLYGERRAFALLPPTPPMGATPGAKTQANALSAKSTGGFSARVTENANFGKPAPPPAKNAGKLLPVDFAGKTSAPKLTLQMRAKRDVASIGWGVTFVFWLLVWNVYYFIRYRIKEGER